MSPKASEAKQVHTRLLKCALEVEDSRAYWRHRAEVAEASAHVAFDEFWFGARSLARVRVLLTNLRARFDAFPGSLAVLARWRQMDPDTRKVLCHWHLQAADPLYRRFPTRSGSMQPHDITKK